MDPLKFYYDNNITVFPLRDNSKIPPRGFKWRQAVQREGRCRSLLDQGKNLGAIVPHDRIVIDVDVRSGGIESLRRLNADLNLPFALEKMSPTVITPTGGYHIWVEVDPALKTRGKFDSVRYPGLDIKKRGGYIVAAGSTINGRKYQWVTDCLNSEGEVFLDPIVMPPKLEPLVKRKVVDEHSPSEAGEFDSTDLMKILEHLDVMDFTSRDDWIQLAMGCHHATAGCPLAREVFVEWSAMDPRYSSSEILDSHRRQWEGLSLDRGITSATLMMFLKEKSHDLAGLKMELFGTTQSSRDDFTDFIEEVKLDEEEGVVETREVLPFCVKSVRDLFASDFKPTYLIEDVLDRDQIMLVSGPKKALKSTMLLDMTLSLATGTPFLDRFPVPERQKTLILTAESGECTFRDKLKAIFKQKQYGCVACTSGCGECYRDAASAGEVCLPNDLPEDSLDWCFTGSEVPRIASSDRLSKMPDVEKLIKLCKYKEIDVVIIDPAYLALTPKDSSNLFSMGELLRGFLDTLKSLDVTVVIAHHATKGAGKVSTDYPDLDTMSGSGFAEFAGQWMLIGRKSEYENDGCHDLLLNIGGRAGHGGNYDLKVNEGKYDHSSDDWRRWELNWKTNFEDFKDETI